MTSIERTAYPRFGRVVSARELDALSPPSDEIEWARQRSRSDQHLLGLVVALKCFQRLGYFPRDRVPEVIIERACGRLGLPPGTVPDAAQRTAEWQRELVRERVGAVFDQQLARSLAERAIREEAQVKNHPPDLINVALEVLVRESLELPGFSTLNEIAARVRAEVNAGMFSGIVARMAQPEVLRANRLLGVGPSGKSEFDALKRAAGKASWSNFRGQVAHMRWVDSLGDSRRWLEGMAESKIADFRRRGAGGRCGGDARHRGAEAHRAVGVPGACRANAGAG